MLAGQVKSLLESSQIECFMKNESLTGGIGELPPIECWPEVWIEDDTFEKRANEIINACIMPVNESAESWRCICGESIEGQFTQCWKCGHSN